MNSELLFQVRRSRQAMRECPRIVIHITTSCDVPKCLMPRPQGRL
jgi:hypothetical protein